MDMLNKRIKEVRKTRMWIVFGAGCGIASYLTFSISVATGVLWNAIGAVILLIVLVFYTILLCQQREAEKFLKSLKDNFNGHV
jgi:Flp pilus assembly protein TadB